MKLYFGTYTKKTSHGLYTADFDEQTGEFSHLQLYQEIGSPTYLSRRETLIISVVKQGDDGGIALLKDGKCLETQLNPGSAPCYVSQFEGLVASANYHTGTIILYSLDHDHLTEIQRVTYEPGSHAHFVDYNPYTQTVFVCDLGHDAIHEYYLVNRRLVLKQTIRTEANDGPRHLAFDKERLYCICELSSQILTYSYKEDGLALLERRDMLDPEEKRRSGAAIRLSPDGQFLYASNRQGDTLTVFRSGPEGLTKVQETGCGGVHPRDFILSSNGQWVLVGNMDSDAVSVFKRDTTTGLILEKHSELAVPEVVCIIG